MLRDILPLPYLGSRRRRTLPDRVLCRPPLQRPTQNLASYTKPKFSIEAADNHIIIWPCHGPATFIGGKSSATLLNKVYCLPGADRALFPVDAHVEQGTDIGLHGNQTGGVWMGS